MKKQNKSSQHSAKKVLINNVSLRLAVEIIFLIFLLILLVAVIAQNNSYYTTQKNESATNPVSVLPTTISSPLPTITPIPLSFYSFQSDMQTVFLEEYKYLDYGHNNEKEKYEIKLPKVSPESKYALNPNNNLIFVFDSSYIIKISFPKEGIPQRFDERPERETIQTNLFGKIDRVKIQQQDSNFKWYTLPVQNRSNVYSYTSYYSEDCRRTMGGVACGLLQVSFANTQALFGKTNVDFKCETQTPQDKNFCDRIISTITIRQVE